MPSIIAAFIIAGALGFAIHASQEQDPTAVPQTPPAVLPASESNPYAVRVRELEAMLFERDNEIVHQQTELANCRATLDSTALTAQASELVRRCEATYGGKCTWDDKLRRVVRIKPDEKEPGR